VAAHRTRHRSITDIKAQTTQPIVLPFLLERLLGRLVTLYESTSR
jgi:hypothetical protein